MMGRSTALFPEAGRPVMRKRRLFACDPEEHVTCLAESLTAFINSLTEDEDDGDDSEDDYFNEE